MSQLTFNFPRQNNSFVPTEEIKTIINDDKNIIHDVYEMSCSSHDIEEEYVFQFRGKRYECISETRDFDIRQFNTLIEWKDWNTIKNRIVNQLKWGPNIREV